jgi:radical SAM superfamily enzyme YgiQ (UPF0313 family)
MKGKKLVFLINAGNDRRGYERKVVNYSIFPPLNVLSIGSSVKERFRGKVTVKIFDGQLGTRDINEEIAEGRPDVVGISVLSASYKNAMRLARTAKRYHATTILGNDHAAIYGERILRSRNGKYVDYICTADIGEIAFCDFLRYLEKRESDNCARVPKNIRYLQNDKYMGEEGDELDHTEYPLDQIPLVDWSLIEPNLWVYSHHICSKYGKQLKDIVEPVVVTINRARGCHKFSSANRCLYCGIKNLHPRLSSPKRFWEEVKAANKTVRANVFYEACDSLSSYEHWVEDLVRHKPYDLKEVRFIVYSEALKIARSPHLVELYKKMGVLMVNMGLDSGDDKMLGMLKGEGARKETNEKAVALLNKAKIHVYASFVLGAPGETNASLRNTREFAETLLKRHQLAAIEVQPLYPLFNARAGEWLMNPKVAHDESQKSGFTIKDPEYLETMAQKWAGNENPDPKELTKDWVRIFCHVKYTELLRVVSQISDCARNEGIPYGQGF